MVDVLTQVPRTKRSFDQNQSWSFEEGDVRGAFKRVYAPGSQYVLFMTVGSQEAVQHLGQYMASRLDMRTPWVVKPLDATVDMDEFPGRFHRLNFNHGLIETYLNAIDRQASMVMGKNAYAHYPLVSTRGVSEKDPQCVFWPQVHMVRNESYDAITTIIDDIYHDEGTGIMRMLESPQDYRIPEIDLLHNNGIAPLVRLERELRMPAELLALSVDFLAQMRETTTWHGPVEYVD